jgi:hypothetical protein
MVHPVLQAKWYLWYKVQVEHDGTSGTSGIDGTSGTSGTSDGTSGADGNVLY